MKKINLTKLIMLSLSAVVSIKTFPVLSAAGLSLISLLTIAMLFFFIPLSLSIAELSSTWPSENGFYIWIEKAYGKDVAFIVMWAYWMESILWFPSMLTFIIGIISFCIKPIIPHTENNVLFFGPFALIIFWGLTYINLKGIKNSSFISYTGVIFGTIIPTILIIIFGSIWYIENKEIMTTITIKTILPKANLNELIFFSGILLGISGIEIIAFHTTNIINPEKNIARAVIISSILIFMIYSSGPLAVTINPNETCLAAGVIKSFDFFFEKHNITFMTQVVGFLLTTGALASMNAWILGPIKGIFITSKDGFLPPLLSKVNEKNIPENLLFLQAIIGSIISIVFFLYSKTLNDLVWLFVSLSFQFSAVFYIVIFLSVIKLRKKYPNVKRPYKVPYHKIACFLGISLCIITFFLSYLQPEIGVKKTENTIHVLILLCSFIILLLPGVIMIYIKKKSGK